MEKCVPFEEKSRDFGYLLTRENALMLASSLILGIIFDLLFYDKPLGVSYPLFLITLYGVFIANMRERVQFKLNFEWSLTIPAVLLALTFCLFTNPVFIPLNFLAVPFLIIAQSILIAGKNRFQWDSPGFALDLVFNFFSGVFGHVFKPFRMLMGLTRKKNQSEKYIFIKRILIGLIISCPLLIIIIQLLSSADQVFGHFTSGILRFLENISIFEFAGHWFVVFFITLFSFSYLFSMREEKDIQKMDISNLYAKRCWDPVILSTILILLNAVYLLFTLIQFSYLFGSLSYALPPDFTYAEYARRGFFELIVVTLINFSILLSCISFTRKGSRLSDNFLKALYTLLVGCTLVMLISSHFRMSLYEEMYGYTYLRVLTHAFMAFLAILFAIAVVKIWNEAMPLVKPYVITALIAFVVINYANIDVIIVKNNLERYQNTRKIDVGYLCNLSYDAVPYLLPLVNDENPKVAGEVKERLSEKKQALSGERPWQAWNFSVNKAKTALEKLDLSKH